VYAACLKLGEAVARQLDMNPASAKFAEGTVHADITQQKVIFLHEVDPAGSPLKARWIGELGISDVAAAVANAVSNATGVRVHNYPITLDKFLDRLPDLV